MKRGEPELENLPAFLDVRKHCLTSGMRLPTLALMNKQFLLLILASCIAACGNRQESVAQPPREPQAQANPPPAPAVSPVERLPDDEQGAIGVVNSSGRSGAYFVPAGPRLQLLPVLVILHGSGQSGMEMVETFRTLAKERRFAIIAPDSRDHDGQLTWEVGDHPGDVTPDLTHTIECVAWMRAHASFLVDESHVLIAGYSGGGSSAPYIATNRPGFTHTAVLHGGVFPGGIGPQRIPAWFSTGEQDRLRPVALVQQAAASLSTLGFSSVTFHSYTGGHELSEPELRELIDWWLAP